MNSHVYVETGFCHGRTVLTDVGFEAPYKLMSPFYEENTMQLMQMCASAGIFGGDQMELSLQIGDGSDLSYLTQSYEKIFPSKDEKTAEKKVRIELGEDASLSYAPHPVIPFAGSFYHCDTEVRMKESSSLWYYDIVACGRVGMQELFQMKQYRSGLRIYVEDDLVFYDNMGIFPDRIHYPGLGLWDGYTHAGMLYCCSGKEKEAENEENWVEAVRRKAEKEQLYAGITACDKGFLIRVLADSGDCIGKFFDGCRRLHTAICS